MHWKPDRLTLVCKRPLDRLLDPPGAVSTQLAALGRVKAFDGLHQTDVSFRNQIQEREPKIGVVMSDLNDQSEICFDHQSPSLPVSPFNPRRQLNLLLWSQQRGLHDLAKVSFDDRIRILTSHIARQKPTTDGGNPQNPICGKSRARHIIPIKWRAFAKCYRVVSMYLFRARVYLVRVPI